MHRWQEWVRETYDAVDAKDTEGYLAQLTDDVRWRFGNGPELAGHDAIRAALIPFFAGLHALSHHMVSQLCVDDTVILESDVTYTRLDGTTVTLPAATVYRLRDGRACRGQIFMDIGPAFASSGAASSGAAVETDADATVVAS